MEEEDEESLMGTAVVVVYAAGVVEVVYSEVMVLPLDVDTTVTTT